MELHNSADTAQRTIIHDAIMAMARFGEANGRMGKVAGLPLTFSAIMNEVLALYRVTSAIKKSHVESFANTLKAKRKSRVSDLSKIEARIMLHAYQEAYPAIRDLWKEFGPTGRSGPGTNKADVPVDDRGMCYPKPNGGKRIIPSIYTHIRKWWMRANGVTVQVQDMNDGHLENTMKLLHESHGNVIAKSTELLGKMANHFHNDPLIVQDLENLCRRMQTVEVDTMYPIFKELAAEAAQRKDTPCMLTAVNPAWFEDGTFDWSDK